MAIGHGSVCPESSVKVRFVAEFSNNFDSFAVRRIDRPDTRELCKTLHHEARLFDLRERLHAERRRD